MAGAMDDCTSCKAREQELERSASQSVGAERSSLHQKRLEIIAKEAEAAIQDEFKAVCQALEQENTNLRQEKEECHAEYTRKLADQSEQHSAAIAELMSEHSTAAREWELMLARRNSDSKPFRFVVRGHETPMLAGAVPHSIFSAEPRSALARLYNGEWEYAKDEYGRAIVNSDPENWPLILNWLSFGTIPEAVPPAFLSECRYWQLDGLCTALEHAAKNTHTFTVDQVEVDGQHGFTVNGTIANFPERLAAAKDMPTAITIPIRAAGRDWEFAVKDHRMALSLLSGSTITLDYERLTLGFDHHQVTIRLTQKQHMQAGNNLFWKLRDDEMQTLLHPSAVNVHGEMQFSMKCLFAND